MGYTVSEAAKRLDVSTSTVYKWIQEGKITTVKVKGKTRIPMLPVIRQTPRGGRWM